VHAGNVAPRVISSVPRLFGQTAWNPGRSLEPSRVASSSGFDSGRGQTLALHLPNFSPICTSGTDLSDLTDCTTGS